MIRAPSVLLQGPTGTGKTHSLVTIMEAGLTLHHVVTEPNGLETLLDAMAKRKVPIDRLRYRVIEPSRPGFDSLFKMATKVTEMGFDSLSKLGPTTRANAQFLTVLANFKDFTDDRTGECYGDVSKLGADSAVSLDSLSGINLMSMDLTIGDKVTAHQGEWGIAMNMIDKLLLTLTSNLKCLFVLTAHVEREIDETTGGTKLMASTLGRKLAPKIPRFFSEVVLTRTEGASYYWSTNEATIDLKHRSLPLGNKLAPTFTPIIDAYHARLRQVELEEENQPERPTTNQSTISPSTLRS